MKSWRIFLSFLFRVFNRFYFILFTYLFTCSVCLKNGWICILDVQKRSCLKISLVLMGFEKLTDFFFIFLFEFLYCFYLILFTYLFVYLFDLSKKWTNWYIGCLKDWLELMGFEKWTYVFSSFFRCFIYLFFFLACLICLKNGWIYILTVLKRWGVGNKLCVNGFWEMNRYIFFFFFSLLSLFIYLYFLHV